MLTFLTTPAGLQLVNLGVTLAVTDLPKLIAALRAMGSAGTATAAQIAAALAQADSIDAQVIANAKAALAGHVA